MNTMLEEDTPTIRIASGLAEIPPSEWDALTDGSPLLSHAFLSALERTGCVGNDTGWQSHPLLVHAGGKLVGALPLYRKFHSYGEYVFDWSWADAYARHGRHYYPKWLVAVPFTPISGARLLTHDNAAGDSTIKPLLVAGVEALMQQHGGSSCHVLFPHDVDADCMRNTDWLERSGVQFVWQNAGYASFEDFLGVLTHDKRKKIRQERKKIADQNIRCLRVTGREVSEAQWAFFFQCYQQTYAQHRSSPYLNLAFFQTLGQVLPDNVLLVLAEQAGQWIAAALMLFDDKRLYGRYWGALHYVPGLHFELCYYQGQQFCIERGIASFEGGAQGEHKLARGFTPKSTYSFHKLADADFEAAVRDFLQRESAGIAHYQDELDARVPFRK